MVSIQDRIKELIKKATADQLHIILRLAAQIVK